MQISQNNPPIYTITVLSGQGKNLFKGKGSYSINRRRNPNSIWIVRKDDPEMFKKDRFIFGTVILEEVTENNVIIQISEEDELPFESQIKS